MKEYHPLTKEEREQISMLRQSSLCRTSIAVAMGHSKSTISRELRCNEAPPRQYGPDTAHTLALKRRKRGNRLDRDEALKDFVITKLFCHYWPPETIAGWLKQRQRKIKPMCYESIYSWLYQPAQKNKNFGNFFPDIKQSVA